MQILIVPNPMAKKYNCGGADSQLSLWNANPEKTLISLCDTSSFLEHGYECEYALNGNMEDNKGGIWKTDNEGVGS